MLINKGKSETARTLFNPEPKKFVMPPLNSRQLEDAYDEIELLGFPVTLTWFDMLQTRFRGDVTRNGDERADRAQGEDGRTPGDSEIY
ncbi:MAG: hypothetical protein MZV63_22625 [Marinilabiliales bacterium]|nr:hypothetical protein [Marinilabiliales bacterium]